MRTNLKKYIPQIIGLLLILAIVILCYFAFFKKSPQTIYIPDQDIIDTSYKNQEEQPVYVRTIPKQSKSSESFLYFQNITGDGNTLYKNLFKTSVGNFLICESDCKNGDIQGDKRSVGIAQLDDIANISKVYTIPSQNSSYYVESQITPSGIVVITTNALKEVFYVNIVSYELDNIKTLIVDYAENCIIYPTMDSFLIISEYTQENIVYRYTNDRLSFVSIIAGSVINILEYGTYYTMFINTTNGYTIAKVSKNSLSILSETYIDGRWLISVTPIMENNTQKFILLESNGIVFARKMSKLDNSDSVVAKLGAFTVKSVCAGNNNLVLVVAGRANGLIYLTYDLTCNYSQSVNNFWVTSVVDHNYINGIYYYLTINDKQELVLITQNGDTTSAANLATNCQAAGFIFHQNQSIMVSYQTVVKDIKMVEIIGIA
ncbi:MAG: hypothetical protein GX242_01315 [Clostridiales bacterium]|nr:hypothetical protein [Clostridiales bacterium]